MLGVYIFMAKHRPCIEIVIRLTFYLLANVWCISFFRAP